MIIPQILHFEVTKLQRLRLEEQLSGVDSKGAWEDGGGRGERAPCRDLRGVGTVLFLD